MTKQRAYTSEWGQQSVSAEQVGRIRRQRFNGASTGEDYFSTHKPGQRKRVKHVMRGSTCYFAYIEGNGNTAASDGESLNHLLFKEALASLERVKLSLYRPTAQGSRHWMDATVRIRAAAMEQRIERAGAAPWFADVRWELEDEGAGKLALRWDGRLYLEVRHTHAVDAAKQTGLRALGLPVVEVEIPELFAYRESEETTSDEAEAAHRLRIKNTLEGPKGFLRATVLCNPRSKPFLEWSVDALKARNDALGTEQRALRHSLQETADALAAAQAQSRALQQAATLRQDEAGTRIQALEQRASEQDTALAQAGKAMSAARQTIARLRQQRSWLGASAGVLAAGLLVAVLWRTGAI